MRMTTRAVLAVAVLSLALPLRASAQDEQCRKLSYRTNFRLNGAQRYIEQADKATFADVKRRDVADALRMLNDAVRTDGTDAFTTWYFFGRAYLLGADLIGADSSLTRAEALAQGDAGCLGEMRRLRRNVWVPLQQVAAGEIQAQRYDSALTLLRRSNLIYREDPGAYMNMASAFLGQQKEDSAAAAFRMASHAGTDPARAELRASATLYAARLLQSTNRPAAESLFRAYVALKPGDLSARGSLATVLAAQGRTTEAAAVYDSILARADSLNSFQLLDAGVSLFNLAVTDTARADSARRQSLLRRAASAFDASAQRNPYLRDGRYRLAITYVGLGDLPAALNAARRLVAVDSLNRMSFQLLAASYQEIARWNARRDSTLRARRDSLPQAARYLAVARAYRDSTLQMLARRDSLPLEVNVRRFEPRDSSAGLQGSVQNLRNQERAGFTLTIEFLNAAGEVVAAERVEVPALGMSGSPGYSYDFNLQATGRGIIAYRYKVN